MKYCSILFLFVYSFCFGQSDIERKSDSLNKAIENTKGSDTLRISILLEWEDLVWNENREKSIELDERVIALADLNLQLKLSEKEHYFYQWAKASSYNNIGIDHKQSGNYLKAIEYYKKSAAIKKKINDRIGYSKSLNNLGTLNAERNNYDAALYFYMESLKIKKELDNQKGIANCYNNMGNIYTSKGDFVKAKTALNKALHIRRKLNDLRGISSTLNNLGFAESEMGDTVVALAYFIQAVEAGKQSGNARVECAAVANTAKTYNDLGDFESAIKYGLIALEMAEKNGLKPQMESAYEALYKAYKGNGQASNALEMLERHGELEDILNNEESQRAMMEQNFQYKYEKNHMSDSLNFAKKEAVLQERSARQELGVLAAIGGLVLVLLLAFVFYRGKKKSDELLLNILPKETADELKANGRVGAKRFDEVSVLFTDFKGFTAVSEQMNPEDLVGEINVCFSGFDKIMEENGIEKIKTIGDSYMAAAGLPTGVEDHSVQLLKAAIAIQEFMHERAYHNKQKNIPYFELRIGVHSGPVVAGVVGIKKFQYDIWGDTVNTASRMESSGEVGRINISHSTYKLVKDNPKFIFEERGEVEAKGKGKLKMYFVGSRV